MRPVRSCVGCRERKFKDELLRVVKTAGGDVRFDITGKSDGRGAYLCRDMGCLDKALKKGGFARTLKCGVSEKTRRELEEQLKAVIGKA